MNTVTDPYREPSLQVAPEDKHVERAFCPWCKHTLLCACSSPVQRTPYGRRRNCADVNPCGRCPSFVPSLLTRMLRKIKRREPVLIERDKAGES